MAPSGILLSLALQLASAACGAWATASVLRTRRFAPDARLTRLAWFFALLAAAMAVQAVVTLARLRTGAHPLVRAAFARELEILYHAAFVAALVLAAVSFRPLRAPVPAAAFAPLALFGPFGAVGLVEAALALYVAVVAVRNNRLQRTRGALRVAAGFLLVFLAQLGFWIAAREDQARPFWGEAIVAAGVLLLVLSVPRPRVPPAPPPVRRSA